MKKFMKAALCFGLLSALLFPAVVHAAVVFDVYGGYPDDLRPGVVPPEVKGNLSTGNRVPGSDGSLEQRYIWYQKDAGGDQNCEVKIVVFRESPNTRLYGNQYQTFLQIQSLAMRFLYDGYYKGGPRTSAYQRITVLGTNVKEKEIGIKPNGVQKQRWPQKLVDGNFHFMEWTSVPVSPSNPPRENRSCAVQAGNVFIQVETKYPPGTNPLLSPKQTVREIMEKLPRKGDLSF